MAVYRVTAPDGSVYRVTAPDDATPEQVRAYAQKQAAIAPAKPALGDSFLSQVGRRVADNMAGLVEGAAALPDMAAQGLGRVLGGIARADAYLSDKLTGDGATMREAARAFENPVTIGGAARRLAPEVPGNNLGRAVGQGLGGVISSVGLGGALARGAGSATTRAVGATLAEKPKLQTAGGVGASVAAELVRQAGAPIPVQVGAALLAGGAAPAAIDAAAVGAGRAAAPLIGGAYTRENAAELLRAQLAGDPDAVANRIRAATVRPAVSGAQPTTAEVAGDSGLAGLQRSLGDIDTKAGARISGRIDENNARRLATADATFGSGRTGALVDTAEQEAARQLARVDRAVGRVGPASAPEVSGASAREVLAARAEQARLAASRMYDDLPGGDEPLQLSAPDAFDYVPPFVADEGLPAFRKSVNRETGMATPKPTGSLAAWVKSQGGLKPSRWNGELGLSVNAAGVGDLRSSGVSGRSMPGLFNAKGKSAEQLYQAAIEDGFFLPREEAGGKSANNLDEFIQALIDDVNGAKTYRMDDTVAQEADAISRNKDFWRQQFDARDLDPKAMTDGDWDSFYRDMNDKPRAEPGQDDLIRNAGPFSPSGPLQNTIAELKRRFYGSDAGEAPPEMRDIMRRVINADTMTVRDVELLARRARQAGGAASDRAQAAYANAVADAIDGFLRSVAPPERVEALREAQAAWKQYASTFRSNEAGKALAKDFGEFTMDPSKVGSTMVQRGRGGADVAERSKAALGETAASDQARAELRRALDAANGDTRQIARVAADYGDALRAFPALAADVRAASETAALADVFRASPLARFRNSQNPEREVATLLRAQDGGGGIRRLINQVADNDEAAAGLRRAMAQYIEDGSESTSKVLSSGASGVLNNKLRLGIKNVLDKTAQSDLLTREQRRVLLNIHRETKNLQFALTANRTAGSSTARNAGTAGKMVSLALRSNPKTSGAKAVYDVVLAALGRADDIRQLATDAMLDPKLAADLLQSPTPDRVQAVLDRSTAYGVGAAAGGVGATGAYSPERM